MVPVAFSGLGAQELLFILLAVLLLFGADKLPEIARALGQGIREFKRAVNRAQSEWENPD